MEDGKGKMEDVGINEKAFKFFKHLLFYLSPITSNLHHPLIAKTQIGVVGKYQVVKN